MEDIAKQGLGYALFIMALGAIIYLYKQLMLEKDKRIEDGKYYNKENAQTIEKVENAHSVSGDKMLQGLNGVKEVATSIQTILKYKSENGQ